MLTLSDYIKIQKSKLEDFETYWIKNWNRDTKLFPLTMEDGDEALWDEMFDLFKFNSKE